MPIKTVLPPLRNKPYGGAWSIHDKESLVYLQNIVPQKGHRKKFLMDYKEWIMQDNDFSGLDKFNHVDFSAGATETFGLFYNQHMDKRLRLFKAEYFYHWLMARNHFKGAVEIGSEPLAQGDVVVISCPFSNTGNMVENFYDILEQCEDLKIPVMLDLAYINISKIKELNLNYKCIHTITTSLSKVFPVENIRIGIRFTRDFYDDWLVAYNQNDYVNLYSVNVGQKCIDRFDNDWLYTKYRSKQIETCEKLHVSPSDCVIFGLAKKGQYDEYNRGGDHNRLCFSRVWDGRINVE